MLRVFMIRNFINHLEEGLLSLLLVSMTLLLFVEVVARFGFNAGIHWVQEVTLLMAAWLVLLGASYGVKTGAHIGVDVFVNLMPKSTHRFIALAAVVLCLIYCGLFFYGSWIYLSKMKMIGIEMEDIPIPKWIPMTVLVIGFGLLAVRFLQQGWKIIIDKEDGFRFADEAKESMDIVNDLKGESIDKSETVNNNKKEK